MENNIYKLGLHETLMFKTLKESYQFLVTRVPGGWIYENMTTKAVAIFVPFNNEHQTLF